jgi:ASC-1-like (ASCH) protein
MINTIEFTAGLIKSHETSLKESLKASRQKRRSLREACDKKVLKEDDDELEDEVVDDVVEDTVEEEPATEPVEDVVEDGEGFEETLDDTVYFCPVCNKHFIASPETADDDIVCPICGETEVLIDMGTAQEALEEEENADVAVELEDIEDVEEPVEDVPAEVPAEEPPVEEFEFDEDDLEEGLRLLAKKHISEKCKLRIRSGKLSKGNLVLEGRLLPQKKTFKVVFEGFGKAAKSKKKFVLEGHTTLFKSSKLKGLFVKEGSKISVKKCGYGILKESKKGYTKVKGLLG